MLLTASKGASTIWRAVAPELLTTFLSAPLSDSKATISFRQK
nr:hypothetical protein [Thermophagus xiamenensis]